MNENHTKLHIEPGLFEWMRFCRNVAPSWLTVDECLAAGYPVYQDYIPVVKEAELNMNESLIDFYDRSYLVSKTLLSRYPTGKLVYLKFRGLPPSYKGGGLLCPHITHLTFHFHICAPTYALP
jgi:hypothetical protein